MPHRIDRQNIILRELRKEDIPFMLEWMHDKSVVNYLESNFLDKTSEECEKFILDARKEYQKSKPFHIHYAIASVQGDEYLGTVSLKNISFQNKAAEFAIVVRKKAMGTGAAKQAMQKIIEKGFYGYNLKYIYWYVAPENKRAVQFYQKSGYQQVEYHNWKQMIGESISYEKKSLYLVSDDLCLINDSLRVNMGVIR